MRHRRPFQIAARLTIALIAFVGQSAMLGIAASADDLGAAAHVERSGVSLHHAHNEATCVVCRVLSLHSRAEGQSTAPQIAVVGHDARPNVVAHPIAQAFLPSNLSRAPPEIA